MTRRAWPGVAWILFAVLFISAVSCGGGSGVSGEGPKKITYKCLSSSCDASVTCNEGDPVPQHCGKPMIH